jgi:thiol-disulfide isomerase/thioredoxin
MTPHLVPVNGLSFAHEVLKSELPVLIDVWADWCPPCKAAAPILAELAARHRGKLKVVAIDGGEAPDLVATLGVRGFPTFLGVRDGEIVLRQAGFGGRKHLEALADDLLGAGSDGASR